MWFVWILSAGARHFIEILPMSLLDDEVNFNLEHHLGKITEKKFYNKLFINFQVQFFILFSKETEEGFTLVNAKSPINLSVDNRIPDFKDISELNPMSILRNLKQALGREQFRQILYAVLIGIQILVRGPPVETLESLYGLCSLVPRACQRVRTHAQEYMNPKMCNFISEYFLSYFFIF